MLCAALLLECDSNHNCLAQEVAKTNTNSEIARSYKVGRSQLPFPIFYLSFAAKYRTSSSL